LIFLSTLTGATLIVQMVTFDPWLEITIFLTLLIAGIAFQAKALIGEPRSQ
jgi:hypothetical protein